MAATNQSLPAESAKSKFYEVPAIKIDHFVGRKYLLNRIHNLFEDGAPVVVLVGMGGKARQIEFNISPVLELICCRPGQDATVARVLQSSTTREFHLLG